MVMSVAVFTVVALVAAGALLAVADANRKAQAFKSVVNNINFALESVARNLRTGSAYSNASFFKGNCASRYTDGIKFTSQAGVSTEYFLQGTQIVRRVESGNAVGVTAVPPVSAVTTKCAANPATKLWRAKKAMISSATFPNVA